MPLHTITYCTMNGDAGANPFGHSCLILSRLDDATQKLKVQHCWGFYSLPRKPNVILDYIKAKTGVEVMGFRLSGAHGMMLAEEVRFLDLGKGLQGITFEVTAEKFESLVSRCQQIMTDQAQAIAEAATEQKLQPTPNKKIYAYEHEADRIYSAEKDKAALAGRPPRLLPFEFSFFQGGYTCKAHVLNLLNGILTPTQLGKIKGYSTTVPRFAGELEPIYLHSSGHLQQHTKASGEVVSFRNGHDVDVQLHWTIPPQLIESLSGDALNLFKLYEGYSDDVRKVVSQLQQLEWVFLNARFEPCYQSQHESLLARIREQYEIFAKLHAHPPYQHHSGWVAGLQWLASQPRDADEEALMAELENANDLIRCLYAAVMDNWEIDQPDDSRPSEAVNELEALATLLPTSKKHQLCQIINGSNYIPLAPLDSTLTLAQKNR
jgi:hypothetical protein